MGKKGKWFSSLKKAFSPESKSKVQKSVQSRKQQQLESNSNDNFDISREAPPLPPELKDVKLVESSNDQNKQSYSSSIPPACAAESAVTEIPSVNEVVSVINVNKFAGKSKQEVAAIKIQTAFRGYLARRALRALRGLVRLKSLMEGPTVKRQATHTLRCMQTLARVQSQIHARRIRMLEENQALQRQLLQKHAKELEAMRIGEEWDDSLQSKEQIEANLLNKYEAAMRRERALAYAFTHQQTLKNSSRSANTMFMTPGNPSWGWSWLERWMSAHPWENRNMAGKEPSNNDQSSVQSASRSLVGGEISKSYARYQLNSDKLSPADSEKPVKKTSPHSASTAAKPAARKLKTASPRSSIGGPDDDSRSMLSVQSSVRDRRHSIGAGSSVRDDESLGSSHGVPSYMVPTESAKAKSRLGAEKNGTPEKEKSPLGSAKKRLSYPPSPARARRHSGPPKLESNSVAVAVNNGTANGDES